MMMWEGKTNGVGGRAWGRRVNIDISVGLCVSVLLLFLQLIRNIAVKKWQAKNGCGQ